MITEHCTHPPYVVIIATAALTAGEFDIHLLVARGR